MQSLHVHTHLVQPYFMPTADHYLLFDSSKSLAPVEMQLVSDATIIIALLKSKIKCGVNSFEVVFSYKFLEHEP